MATPLTHAVPSTHAIAAMDKMAEALALLNLADHEFAWGGEGEPWGMTARALERVIKTAAPDLSVDDVMQDWMDSYERPSVLIVERRRMRQREMDVLREQIQSDDAFIDRAWQASLIKELEVLEAAERQAELLFANPAFARHAAYCEPCNALMLL